MIRAFFSFPQVGCFSDKPFQVRIACHWMNDALCMPQEIYYQFAYGSRFQFYFCSWSTSFFFFHLFSEPVCVHELISHTTMLRKTRKELYSGLWYGICSFLQRKINWQPFNLLSIPLQDRKSFNQRTAAEIARFLLKFVFCVLFQ